MSEKNLSELAQRFLSVIKEKKITPYELGKKGINSQIFYNIKAGKSDPSLKTINALLNVFPDINPEWINYGRGTMYQNTYLTIDNKELNISNIDTIISFLIENEKEILKSNISFKNYIRSKENNAIINYLQSSIDNFKN